MDILAPLFFIWAILTSEGIFQIFQISMLISWEILNAYYKYSKLCFINDLFDLLDKWRDKANKITSEGNSK